MFGCLVFKPHLLSISVLGCLLLFALITSSCPCRFNDLIVGPKVAWLLVDTVGYYIMQKLD